MSECRPDPVVFSSFNGTLPKIMKTTITFLIVVLLIPVVSFASKEPDYKNTIDYIEKTGRLWGIAEVRINADDSVTLVDAESGYGSELMLSLGEVVKSRTIKAGESCTLSDGHHAFITYEFKESKKGKITFIITDTFDARSFGDGVKKETKTITISPYKEEQKPQQSPKGDVLKAAPEE